MWMALAFGARLLFLLFTVFSSMFGLNQKLKNTSEKRTKIIEEGTWNVLLFFVFRVQLLKDSSTRAVFWGLLSAEIV